MNDCDRRKQFYRGCQVVRPDTKKVPFREFRGKTDGDEKRKTKIPVRNPVLQGQVVVLNWKTASEINNSYFEILRSTDPSSEGWQMIGHMKGAGTTMLQQSYKWKEDAVMVMQYYKLRQVDVDGHSSYSAIRAVQTNEKELQILLTADGVGVLSTETTTATLTIYSEIGEQLFEKQIELEANNFFPFTIDLENGIYLFHVTTVEKSLCKKIVIQR